jgi:hypothetical protein
MINNPYTPPENTCVERRELNPRVLRASMAMTYALLQYGIASYLFLTNAREMIGFLFRGTNKGQAFFC